MNRQGQEGEGFRLLVEAVLVVLILVIIMSVISQVENWLWNVSEQRVFEGFSKALKSPNGDVIFEKDIVLRQGLRFTSDAFAKSTAGIEKECIELQASDSTAFSKISERAVEIASQIKTPVYYKCLPGYAAGNNECETYCIVSFGEELKKE